MKDFDKIYLLGVAFTDASKKDILEFIYTGLQKNKKKYYIVTPNPELLVIANKNKKYKDILNRAKLALPDGVGITLGARVMGKSLKERITGVDFMESLCEYASKRPITVGFLGAGPNVADKTAECLQKKYPGLKVTYVSKEWDEANFKSQSAGPRTKLQYAPDSKNEIDILFVAFGSPKQEIWISKNLDKLPAKIVIGVGGAFDFVGGNVPRAPKYLRDFGLEWLFRLFVQPWRIKRQISLLDFVYLIFRDKAFGRSY